MKIFIDEVAEGRGQQINVKKRLNAYFSRQGYSGIMVSLSEDHKSLTVEGNDLVKLVEEGLASIESKRTSYTLMAEETEEIQTVSGPNVNPELARQNDELRQQKLTLEREVERLNQLNSVQGVRILDLESDFEGVQGELIVVRGQYGEVDRKNEGLQNENRGLKKKLQKPKSLMEVAKEYMRSQSQFYRQLGQILTDVATRFDPRESLEDFVFFQLHDERKVNDRADFELCMKYKDIQWEDSDIYTERFDEYDKARKILELMEMKAEGRVVIDVPNRLKNDADFLLSMGIKAIDKGEKQEIVKKFEESEKEYERHRALDREVDELMSDYREQQEIVARVMESKTQKFLPYFITGAELPDYVRMSIMVPLPKKLRESYVGGIFTDFIDQEMEFFKHRNVTMKNRSDDKAMLYTFIFDNEENYKSSYTYFRYRLVRFVKKEQEGCVLDNMGIPIEPVGMFYGEDSILTTVARPFEDMEPVGTEEQHRGIIESIRHLPGFRGASKINDIVSAQTDIRVHNSQLRGILCYLASEGRVAYFDDDGTDKFGPLKLYE